jgi:hypothetical protein
LTSPFLQPIQAFLTSIGLETCEAAVPTDSFLPGVFLRAGTIEFDQQRLSWPGDLLHEAGHLAVTPAAHRKEIIGTLTPEQHFPQGGEVEAIAWSFAALSAIGLPIDVLFHPEGYKGQSTGLAFTYSLGVYPGAFGLELAGLTATPATAASLRVPPYPHMLHWLRA